MRRLMKMGFTPDQLLIMGTGDFEVVRNELPEDAAVVGSYKESERDLFVLVIQSESFQPVEGYLNIPFLSPPVIQRK